jgi:hypothetical protein
MNQDLNPGLSDKDSSVRMERKEGWGCSLVVERLAGKCEALGSIPSTRMRETRARERERQREEILLQEP